MNKVILLGRLTRDPEVRYSSSNEPLAIARYTLAIDRRYKKNGEKETDFIDCVAFGKAGEFIEKYYKKGQLVSVVGRIQTSSWNDQEGNKRYRTEVVTDEHYFAESKSSTSSSYSNSDNSQNERQSSNSRQSSNTNKPASKVPSDEGFFPIDDDVLDEDLPF